jgi:hypothetical protein
MTTTVRKTVRERAASEAARLRLPVRIVAHNLLKDSEGPSPRRPWTKAEDDQIRLHYAADAEGLADRLGRTLMAVRRRAQALRVTAGRRVAAWSDTDLALLKQEYPAGDLDRLAELLGRTRAAIGLKAREVGLRRADCPTGPKSKKWYISGEVVRVLHGQGWTDTRIGRELGVAQEAVSKVRRKLGLIAHASFEPGVSGMRPPDAEGWPLTLPVLAARVLTVLADRGARTPAELVEDLGFRRGPGVKPSDYLRCKARDGSHRSALAVLEERGLVRRCPGPPGGWMLSPKGCELAIARREALDSPPVAS